MLSRPQKYLNFLSYLTIVFDQIDEQITLITEDGTDYQIVLANDAFAQWIDLPVEGIQTKALKDILPNEIANELRIHYSSVYETRKQQSLRLVWTDGRILNLVSHPIMDALDEPLYLACIATDVTELEKERARREETEASTNLYETVATELVLTIAPDGTIDLVGGGLSHFGLEPSQLYGRHLHDLLVIMDDQTIDGVVEALPANGRATHFEAVLKLPGRDSPKVRCTIRRSRIKSTAESRITMNIAAI